MLNLNYHVVVPPSVVFLLFLTLPIDCQAQNQTRISDQSGVLADYSQTADLNTELQTGRSVVPLPPKQDVSPEATAALKSGKRSENFENAIAAGQDVPAIRGVGRGDQLIKLNVTQAAQQDGAINEITTRIAKKEVELLKLNTAFRLHYTKHNHFEESRLNLYNIAASSTATAGLISMANVFKHYSHNPLAGLKHRARLEGGITTVMIAYLIEGGGHSAEFLIDQIKDFRGMQKGFSARNMVRRVSSLRKEIDDLIAERDKLVNGYQGGNRDVLAAEGKVLKDWRDLDLLDFSTLYTQSRKQKMVRDLTNAGTVAVSATGAFPGALMTLKGVDKTRLKTVGGSGVGFLISAGILTAAPFLFKFGEIMQGQHCTKKMNDMIGEFECHAAENMDKDIQTLNAAVNTTGSGSASLNGRLEAYKMTKNLFAERHDIIEKERRASRRQFIEDVISYGARGGIQIPFSIRVMDAGYKNLTNPARAFREVSQAATIDIPSWALWMGDFSQREIRHEASTVINKKQPSFAVHGEILKQVETAVER